MRNVWLIVGSFHIIKVSAESRIIRCLALRGERLTVIVGTGRRLCYLVTRLIRIEHVCAAASYPIFSRRRN